MPVGSRLSQRWALGFALGGALGCAGTTQRPLDPTDIPEGPGVGPSAAAEAAPQAAPLPPLGPAGPVPRTALAPVLGRGLGPFLATLEVSPVLSRGRFVGFRLERAEALARWRAAGLDLRPGDVVTAVNDRAIERPGEALEAFQSLRGAPALRLAVMRPEGAVVLTVPLGPP